MYLPTGTGWKVRREVNQESKKLGRHFNSSDCTSQPKWCLSMPSASVQPASITRVALFHYVTKSRFDYDVKMQRGSGMTQKVKPLSFYEGIERCDFVFRIKSYTSLKHTFVGYFDPLNAYVLFKLSNIRGDRYMHN